MTDALTLFRHSAPNEELAKAMHLRESDSGSRTVGLLPSTSKDGPSLSQLCGLKGQALKKFKRTMQDELKRQMAKEFAGLSASADWTGRKLTVLKTGAIGFFLEPTREGAASPKVVVLEQEVARKVQELAALRDAVQRQQEQLNQLMQVLETATPNP